MKDALRVSGESGAVVLFEPRPETLEKIRINDPDHPDAADPSRYVAGLNVHETKIKGSLMEISIYRAT